jgi:hypothetical protein
MAIKKNLETVKTIIKQIAFLKRVTSADTKRSIQKLQQKLDDLIKKSNGRDNDKPTKT